MQGKIKCFAFCVCSVHKGCLHMTLYFSFHTSFLLTVFIQPHLLFLLCQILTERNVGVLVFDSGCQGRSKGWRIKVSNFYSILGGFWWWLFSLKFLYLNTGAWKESSAVSVGFMWHSYLWFSNILDWIQQKGGNRGTGFMLWAFGK